MLEIRTHTRIHTHARRHTRTRTVHVHSHTFKLTRTLLHTLARTHARSHRNMSEWIDGCEVTRLVLCMCFHRIGLLKQLRTHSFTCVPQLIHMCARTYSSFSLARSLSLFRTCDMVLLSLRLLVLYLSLSLFLLPNCFISPPKFLPLLTGSRLFVFLRGLFCSRVHRNRRT